MLNDVFIEPEGGKASRAVIILHGLGDSASGIIELGQAMRSGLPETVFLAPDAPAPCDFSPFGYQWFSSGNWTPSVVLEGVKKAAPLLNEYIDHAMEARGLTPDKVALVGFSQGTMMALYVAPRRAPALAGVLGYSGALIGGEDLPKERKSAPPIFLAHGMNDEVVPFAAMEQARAGLHRANLNVGTLACPGLGHSVDDEGLRQGVIFLRRVFKL